MKSKQERGAAPQTGGADVPAEPMRVNTPASVGAAGGGGGGEDVTGLFVEIPAPSAGEAILLNIQRAQGALQQPLNPEPLRRMMMSPTREKVPSGTDKTVTGQLLNSGHGSVGRVWADGEMN